LFSKRSAMLMCSGEPRGQGARFVRACGVVYLKQEICV